MYFCGPSQQPADVVQFVGAIEDDPTAQLFARAVALPIVLPRPPVRKILSGLSAEPEHAPDLAGIDQPFQNLQAGMKAHVVADLHTSPVAARFEYEELDSTRFVRQ